MKIFLVSLFLLACQVDAFSQKTRYNYRKPRFNYSADGSFGIYIPSNERQGIAQYGSYNSFGLRAEHRSGLFARFFYDNVILSYKYESIATSPSVNIKDRLISSVIGLDLGYRRSFGRFTNSIYVGSGTASVEIPRLRIDDKNVVYTNARKSFVPLRVGLRSELTLSKVAALYVEGSYLYIPFKDDFTNTALSGIALQLGFKTPLQ